MTEEEYRENLDGCHQRAGTSEGDWNGRFLLELNKELLVMLPIALYPKPFPAFCVQAPKPFGEEGAWEDSWIMPIQLSEDQKKQRYGEIE